MGQNRREPSPHDSRGLVARAANPPPRRADRERLWLGVFAGLAAVLALLCVDSQNDDAFITYRYAQNLLLGRGFVFNPGEPVLGTTAPLHGLLLAAAGVVWRDIPTTALVVSWLGTVALAFTLYRILAASGNRAAGVIAGTTVAINLSTGLVFSLETVLLAAFCWAALHCAQRDRFGWVSVLGALAVLTRADAALCLAGVFVVDLWQRRDLRKVIRSGLLMSLLCLPWFLFAFLYYGAPLSLSAATKTGWPGRQWHFASALWSRGFSGLFADDRIAAAGILVAAVGLVAILRRPRYRWLRVVPVWMLLYGLAYSALRIYWHHHWYYYPIVVGCIVFFAIGATEIQHWLCHRPEVPPSRVRPLQALLLVLLLAVFATELSAVVVHRNRSAEQWYEGGRNRIYRQVADWLRTHSDPIATVAAHEPGMLGYYSDRRMIDMGGLVTPGIGERMKAAGARSADVSWIARELDPDYFVLLRSRAKPISARLPEDPRHRLLTAISEPESPWVVLVYGRRE